MNCMYCSYGLPDRGYYCPNCSAQVRCKKCSETLEPNAKTCVMCGTKVKDEVETLTSKANTTELAVNTFELSETIKNRTIRAKFTDNVGTVFAETLALFAGNRFNTGDSQRKVTKDNRSHFSIPLAASTLPDKEEVDEEEEKDNRSGIAKDGISNDLEKINMIFRFDDDRVTLKEPRIKANSKLDYGKRIIYIFLYANELRGTNQVSRDNINAILKEANVYDSNIRYWIANNPDLTTDNNMYELRNSGQIKSKQIISEIFDANKPDGWMPGTKTTKSSSVKKTKRKNDNENIINVGKEDEEAKKTSPKSSLPNPTKVLNRLINEGYFAKVREIQDIISHCKTLGYTYKSNDFSMPLLRLVRGLKLNRTTNQAGRYEYKA